LINSGGDFYGEEPVRNTRKNLGTSTFTLGMSKKYILLLFVEIYNLMAILLTAAESEVPVSSKGIRHIPGKSTFTIGKDMLIVYAHSVIIKSSYCITLYQPTGHAEPVPTVNENVNSAANRRRNAGGGASTLQLF